MAQYLVGAPFFAKLDGRAIQITVILFQLPLESGKQRERVASGARKSGKYFIVVKPANLARARLHHRFTHRNLAIAGHRDFAVATYQQNCRAADAWRILYAHQRNEHYRNVSKE